MSNVTKILRLVSIIAQASYEQGWYNTSAEYEELLGNDGEEWKEREEKAHEKEAKIHEMLVEELKILARETLIVNK